MDVRKISPEFYAAYQLWAADLGAIAAQGIKSVINNRPDGEVEGQPTSAEIAAAAQALGLEYRYVPVLSGVLTDENADEFGAALRELPGPILAFCRTGTRSTILWALSEAQSRDVDTIVRAAGDAGYDLSKLRPRLQARAATAASGGPVSRADARS